MYSGCSQPRLHGRDDKAAGSGQAPGALDEAAPGSAAAVRRQRSGRRREAQRAPLTTQTRPSPGRTCCTRPFRAAPCPCCAARGTPALERGWGGACQVGGGCSSPARPAGAGPPARHLLSSCSVVNCSPSSPRRSAFDATPVGMGRGKAARRCGASTRLLSRALLPPPLPPPPATSPATGPPVHRCLRPTASLVDLLSCWASLMARTVRARRGRALPAARALCTRLERAAASCMVAGWRSSGNAPPWPASSGCRPHAAPCSVLGQLEYRAPPRRSRGACGVHSRGGGPPQPKTQH